MSESKSSIYYFIVNPRAGSGKTMSKWVPAEKRLTSLGIPFKTALTDHKRHAVELAKIAARLGYRKIFAVGGDGSIHEVFYGICTYCRETGTPVEDFYIGVIPIGSGNDWIKSTGVPNDTEDAIDLIKENSFGKMDVFRTKMNSTKISYMANIGGVGFDSHVCIQVNSQKERGMRGKMIYLNSLVRTIFTLKPINISLVADGNVVFTGEAFSIAFGNGKYSGSGMRQVPIAEMDDGMVDYTIIPKMSLKKLFSELPRLFRGTLHKSQYVFTGRCKSLQVVPMDAKSVDAVEFDGEVEGTLPLSIEYTGYQINILKGKE